MKIPEVDFEKKPEPKKKEKDRYPNPVIIVNLSQEEMNTLNKISNSEYSKKPYAFKYGNFKLTDFFHSLLTDENR